MVTRPDVQQYHTCIFRMYKYDYIWLNKIIKKIEHKITRICCMVRERMPTATNTNETLIVITRQDLYENRFECIYSNIQVTGIELIS